MARVMAEPPRVRAVDEENLPSVRRFLEQHADTSMFLLSILATNGPRMGEALNSGDFKLIEHDGDVRAVFCLTRRTPILAEAGGRTEYARAIVEACLNEPRPIGGVLGEWTLADAIWSILRERPSFKEIYACKEILQARDLTEADASHDATPHVRRLRPEDFDQWDALNNAFAQAEGLPRHGTPAERKTLFEDSTRAGRWWGYFEDDRLCSTAGLNALYKAHRTGRRRVHRAGKTRPRPVHHNHDDADGRVGAGARAAATRPVHRRPQPRRPARV